MQTLTSVASTALALKSDTYDSLVKMDRVYIPLTLESLTKKHPSFPSFLRIWVLFSRVVFL